MKIKPQNNKCLISIEDLEKTKSGIIISNADNIIIEVARVKEIGDKVKKIKIGDKIMFKSWSLDIVEIEDIRYSFIAEEDILAVI